MKYIESANEIGYTYDGCNGRTDWLRTVRIVTADTLKELSIKKLNIKKEVEKLGDEYSKVYLEDWKIVDENKRKETK